MTKCTDRLLSRGHHSVMAMLLLRVEVRSVHHIRPSSPLHAHDNLPSHPCDQNTRQHTKTS